MSYTKADWHVGQRALVADGHKVHYVTVSAVGRRWVTIYNVNGYSKRFLFDGSVEQLGYGSQVGELFPTRDACATARRSRALNAALRKLFTAYQSPLLSDETCRLVLAECGVEPPDVDIPADTEES